MKGFDFDIPPVVDLALECASAVNEAEQLAVFHFTIQPLDLDSRARTQSGKTVLLAMQLPALLAMRTALDWVIPARQATPHLKGPERTQ